VSEIEQEMRALSDAEKERWLRALLEELDGPPDAGDELAWLECPIAPVVHSAVTTRRDCRFCRAAAVGARELQRQIPAAHWIRRD